MSKSKYKKRDINTLILFAQKGDVKALEELIRRVQRNIYVVFSHLTDKKDDISDLTQETLLKMAKALRSFFLKPMPWSVRPQEGALAKSTMMSR